MQRTSYPNLFSRGRLRWQSHATRARPPQARNAKVAAKKAAAAKGNKKVAPAANKKARTAKQAPAAKKAPARQQKQVKQQPEDTKKAAAPKAVGQQVVIKVTSDHFESRWQADRSSLLRR
ncbi:hypothetical protein [Ralstonia phage phiRSL1]|uniref:Uncharacterized protein n=1 Tax=Ralstonia phage phiRSL1 TaxID=1980924 RepID=C4T8X6_9CAUD|nr:hypothetical protein RSL1_ORF328 [Ralstonia phage phiRSL1]BAH72950.1 hypothetical protein [Ralstonia phage phiRSL1]